MTNCRRYDDDLKAYADGELPLLRRLAVRRHLSRCAACRKELTAMQTITDDLRANEGTEPLDSALRAKLLADIPAPPLLRASSRRPSRAVLAWGVGAVAVAMWFLLYPLFSPRTESDYRMATSSQLASGPMASAPVAAGHPQMPLGLTQHVQDNDEPPAAPPKPAMAASGIAPMDASGFAQMETLTRQVHKEATIGVEVDDAEAKSDQVAQMVKAAGGFVAANTLATNGDGAKSADLTVKVPVVQFETLLGQVAKLGNVQAKNIIGEDITGRISDSDQAEGVLEDEARRADAHLAALGKKAGWRDQQAAQNTRIELAQARARLQMLKHMAALSTLTISLTEKAKPAAPPPVTSGFLGGLSDTTHAALGSLLASAGALLALLIWLLAYAPLWLPLALIGRYIYRRSRSVTV